MLPNGTGLLKQGDVSQAPSPGEGNAKLPLAATAIGSLQTAPSNAVRCRLKGDLPEQHMPAGCSRMHTGHQAHWLQWRSILETTGESSCGCHVAICRHMCMLPHAHFISTRQHNVFWAHIRPLWSSHGQCWQHAHCRAHVHRAWLGTFRAFRSVQMLMPTAHLWLLHAGRHACS